MENKELLVFRTIGTEMAVKLGLEAVKAAGQMGVSGFVLVYSRTGMQECSYAVGLEAKPLNVQIALAKIETVLSFRQSTGVRARYIEKKNIYPENYAGAVKTMFGGGLAIFADPELKEFVGAIAFSGGEEWQDIQICCVAIHKAGLYTDEPRTDDEPTPHD